MTLMTMGVERQSIWFGNSDSGTNCESNSKIQFINSSDSF